MTDKTDSPKTLININRKTFIQVTVLLLVLMIISIVLTYLIPAGEFGKFEDGTINYQSYEKRPDIKGINVFKGLLAPILVFASGDGLNLIMLSLFLLIISASFQVMEDVGGIKALVGSVADRFKEKRSLLIAVIAFVFMCFGAFLGLFEEMLTMLPIVTLLCVTVGYDSFTGFLISIVACGFGFASAVTNPFTVLLASELIGTDPTAKIWYRLIIFAVMFALLILYVYKYTGKITKNPDSSLTYNHDIALRKKLDSEESLISSQSGKNRFAGIIYAIFLIAGMALIIICSSVQSLRGYTVVFLIAYFLIFGIAAGIIVKRNAAFVLKSFIRGIVGALPTIVFIALAGSVKFILEEGSSLPTIVNQINILANGKNPFVVALIIYLIVLLLEFFISSSTAKAVLVMGILAVANIGLSKQMLVLLYTFADGYTNLIFPTSPVLLISLSMINVEYFKWIKKSVPLFILNGILVIVFIFLGLLIKY